MNNVVGFTGKFLPLRQLISIHVEKVKDFIPANLFNVFLNMDGKGLRDTLHQSVVDHLAWGLFRNGDEEVVGVSFNSQVRPLLVPEFGVQKNNDFLSFHWVDYTPSIPMKKVRFIPIEEISESLTQYYVDRFPKTDTSNKIAFSYAILSSICLHDKFKITHYGFDKNQDCFIISFIEFTDDLKVCREYSMQCDFAPILLDSLALNWYVVSHPKPD